MTPDAVPYGRKTQRPSPVSDVHILWITAGLGCDGDSVSITAATQPSIEDVLLGAIPGLPRVHLHNPVLAYENGDDFLKYWYQAEQVLYAMSQGLDYNWSIFKTRGTDLILPNGTALHYPDLERVLDDNALPFWRYQSRYGWRRIWGGFLVENVIQAVSRVDIGQCWLRLADMGYRVVLMEHDALGIVVRNETAEHDCDVILAEMKRAPIWLPDIPLDAEATMGEGYS